MRKTAAFLLLCICVAAPAAFASPPPPGEAREMDWTRRPVLFSHQAHFAGMGARDGLRESCARCHHPVNGERVFKTCASEGCHDSLDPKDKSPQSYFQATHKKKTATFYSCVSCHEEQAGADAAKKKRLAGCKESACHPS